MRFEFMKIPRWCSSASIFTVLLLLAAGGAGASGGDYGYVGEIRLYATPFCPGSPHAEDVTGRPGVGNAPHTGEVLRLAHQSCPDGSIEADGREMNVQVYSALFYLLNTTYGEGRSYSGRSGSYPVTFRVPDLRRLAPPNIKYCLAIDGSFPMRPEHQ